MLFLLAKLENLFHSGLSFFFFVERRDTKNPYYYSALFAWFSAGKIDILELLFRHYERTSAGIIFEFCNGFGLSSTDRTGCR